MKAESIKLSATANNLYFKNKTLTKYCWFTCTESKLEGEEHKTVIVQEAADNSKEGKKSNFKTAQSYLA